MVPAILKPEWEPPIWMNYTVFTLSLILLFDGIYMLFVFWIDGNPKHWGSLEIAIDSEGTRLVTGMAGFSVVMSSLVCCLASIGCIRNSQDLKDASSLMNIMSVSASITGLIFAIHLNQQLSVGALPIAQLKDVMYHQVKHMYYNNMEEQSEEVTNFWDKIQFDYKCCGVMSAQDWKSSFYSKTTNLPWPKTCCSELREVYKTSTEVLLNPLEETATISTRRIKLMLINQSELTEPCYEEKTPYEKGCFNGIFKEFEAINSSYYFMNTFSFVLSFTVNFLYSLIM